MARKKRTRKLTPTERRAALANAAFMAGYERPVFAEGTFARKIKRRYAKKSKARGSR